MTLDLRQEGVEFVSATFIPVQMGVGQSHKRAIPMRQNLASNRDPNGRIPSRDHPYPGFTVGRKLWAGVIGGGVIL